MVNKYYQEHKERLQKEASLRYHNFSKEEKYQKQKKAQKDILFCGIRKRKKNVSIIRRIRRSYQIIEEIII